jgi:hypothetical protein
MLKSQESAEVAAVAGAWLVLAVALFAAAVRRWWARPSLQVRSVARVGAAAYLVAGAGWALVAAQGRDPFGVGDTLVLLTAVHFHFAGAASAYLLARLDNIRPVPWAVAAAVLSGPVLVALGFVGPGELQSAGAAVLTAGLVGVALLTLGRGWCAHAPGAARLCLVVSSLAVLAGMALALHWAVGPRLGWRVMSIDEMARTHGVLNGGGFVAIGLLGRRLEDMRCSH